MSAELLQVRSLVKRFGGLVATDHATLDVRTGELHALIGPNGAGKTTLVHQLCGLLPSDAGQVLFDGHDVTRLPLHARVRRGLARSFQITSVFKRLSVLDNAALAVQGREPGRLNPFGRARADAARLAEAAAVLAEVGLGDRLDRLAGALSHGEQRQLELGIALATRPRLLLLDEPLAGMGPDESARMVELLQRLRARCTLLLIEHDMDAVFRLADRVSAMVAGRVIATGTPDEIRADAAVRAAYLGDEAHA